MKHKNIISQLLMTFTSIFNIRHSIFNIRFGILFIFNFVLLQNVMATHEVGGYILVKYVGDEEHPFNYQVTIVTFTNCFGTLADRDCMRICYGDGTSDSICRVNGPIDANGYPGGVHLCNWNGNTPLYGARKINIYVGPVHAFPGDGTYRIHTQDADRMASIQNMNNSVDVEYYMYNTLTISPYYGGVNSPEIQNDPVCINGCTGECFLYNPGAYSPNGDSLSYTLGQSLTCLDAIGCNDLDPTVCPGYSVPATTTLDNTGTLKWCRPDDPGFYNFVILITTYQTVYVNGVKEVVPADTCELELETNVFSCNYPPPKIIPLDTCVVAGDSVKLTYTATAAIDANPPAGAPYVDPQLNVSWSGLPFTLNPAATMDTTSKNGNPVYAHFSWLTACPEVSTTPYAVNISADYWEPDIFESPLKPDTLFMYGDTTSYITVVGPAPHLISATVEGTEVCLTWNRSPCAQASGYNIYRHTGCSDWQHAYCETGVPASTGYVLVGTTTGLLDTTFCDSNGGAGLSPGVEYSYVIDAYYPTANPSYPLSDGAQSYASNDTCVLIKLSVPFLINVSVDSTSSKDNGKIFVRWQKPLVDANELDTNVYPPPYTYVLMHAPAINGQNFLPVATYTTAYFKNSSLDTTFMDKRLNTQDSGYDYKVNLYCRGDSFVGSSGTASSIFLGLHRGDHQMTLNWISNVPWIDSIFKIYREDPGASHYDSIGYTSNTTYTDSGLSNGYQYCYYVESVSHYVNANVSHPLYDSSETICGIPADTIAPCAPPLSVTAKCLLYEDSIVWSNPDRLCPKANKVVQYLIYYTPVEGGDMSVIATITNLDDTVYVETNTSSVAGCFAVVAVDSAGQQSPLNTICVDNCPIYQIPNVFTPGQNLNSILTPVSGYRYVKSVDLDFFNRWGQIVYQTLDPAINWNGNDQSTNQPCPDGIYYYIGTVNEIRVEGVVPISVHGFVQLIR